MNETRQLPHYTINVGGTLMDLSVPRVMGILNVTPDSFYAQSRKQTEADIELRTRQMLAEGADMIDIGAYSSRPGADDVSPEQEMERLRHALAVLRRVAPDAVVSVDTFRADVARMCVEEFGVQIINDISGGELDGNMFSTVASLGVPYILMHMKGNPQNMQQAPHVCTDCTRWGWQISSSTLDSASQRRWSTTMSSCIASRICMCWSCLYWWASAASR